MAKKDAYEPESEPDHSEGYAPAVHVGDNDEAKRYQHLLGDHDIPAEVGEPESEDGPNAMGIPVLVPAEMLDEALEVIADFEEAEDLIRVDEESEGEEDEDEEDELTPVDEEDEYLDVAHDENKDNPFAFGNDDQDEDDEDL